MDEDIVNINHTGPIADDTLTGYKQKKGQSALSILSIPDLIHNYKNNTNLIVNYLIIQSAY